MPGLIPAWIQTAAVFPFLDQQLPGHCLLKKPRPNPTEQNRYRPTWRLSEHQAGAEFPAALSMLCRCQKYPTNELPASKSSGLESKLLHCSRQ